MLVDFSKLWGGRFLQTLVGIGTLACLLRLLTEHDYGLFALSVSVAGVVAGIAQLGLSSGTSKLINDSLALAPRRVMPLFRRTLSMQVVAYVVFAGLCTGLIAQVYPAAFGERPWLVVGVVVAVFATVASEHFLRTARTVDDFGGIAVHQVSMAAARFLGAVGAYWLFGSLDAALVAYAVLQCVVALAFLGRLYRLLVKRATSAPAGSSAPSIRTWEIAVAAVPFFAIASSNVIFSQIGQLVLGAIALTTLAGFDAATRLTNALRSPAVALSSAVSSRFGRQLLAADNAGATRTLDLTLRTAGLGVPIALGLYFVAPWALWVLGGERYAAAEPVVRTLVPYFVGAFACDALSLSLDYSGRAGQRAVVTITTAALHVGLTLALAPGYGALGVAGALSVSTLVQASLYLFLFRAQFRLGALLRYGTVASATCILPFVNLAEHGLDTVPVRLLGSGLATGWLLFALSRFRKPG